MITFKVRKSIVTAVVMLLVAGAMFAPALVWASTYGSGAYGGCDYGSGCASGTKAGSSSGGSGVSGFIKSVSKGVSHAVAFGVSHGIANLKRAAGAVPGPVARSFPWILLLLLAILALRFIQQAYHEATELKRFKLLRQKQALQVEERQNFTNLIYHYFNTPLSLISGSYDLLASQKLITTAYAAQQLGIAQSLLAKARQLIHHAEKDSQAVPPAPAKTPALWPIIVSVLAVGLVLGLGQWLFYSAGVFKPSAGTLVIVLLIYLLLAQLVIFGRRNYFTRQRRVATESALYEQEQALARSQTKFLLTITGAIGADVAQIQAGYSGLSAKVLADASTEILRSGVERLQSLLARLSLINQIMKSEGTEGTTAVDLGQVVGGITKNHAPAISAKHIKLTTNVGNLTALSFPGGYTAMVIDSLVDNAIKFSQPGGAVDISARAQSGMTEITVTDHGPGIDQGKLEELFRPFSRAGSTLQFNYEGWGLSLYFDKILLAKMAGTINLVSSPAQGTSVTVRLPQS